MKKIIAMMMALMIIATMVGCGQTEPPKPLETPKVTATPTVSPSIEPTVAPTDTPVAVEPIPSQEVEIGDWRAELESGDLKGEKILEDKHLARVVYLLPSAGDDFLANYTADDFRLIGYLDDNAKIINTLKQLCEQYMSLGLNYDYKTVTGREEWSMYTDELRNMAIEQQVDLAQISYTKENKIICEYKGISEYTDMMILASGKGAIVVLKAEGKVTGTDQFMESIGTDKDGNVFCYCIIAFTKTNGQWQVESYLDEYRTPFVIKTIE